MELNVNLNWRIRFKVRSNGMHTLRQHFGNISPDENGYYEAALWAVMNAFGSELFPSFDAPIESEITIITE